jgi:short-subunit dehydrogenase
MIVAVTELAHRVLPGMKEKGFGRIINLSSLAAFSPPGAGLLYTAIKSYVLDMSQSLDMELKPHGIHVTALCPGFTLQRIPRRDGRARHRQQIAGPALATA